ncbi:unnamed protein product [Symbiodinium necroappetens]|uniref:Uncharacterized protein n=1 Tax=Symbiodinium necroappetens TaxID=1628268 RepID=A0A813AGH1_9DINO|nr:unnamed protein product [Symbiodinium necroappetens]|mmetsp:Transcript_94461/g.225081  ORF Transcript_94461/g.225081 Transcript_94461/m.225081 type:complete len:641 (-) Transcript_94461:161-2083(-)
MLASGCRASAVSLQAPPCRGEGGEGLHVLQNGGRLSLNQSSASPAGASSVWAATALGLSFVGSRRRRRSCRLAAVTTAERTALPPKALSFLQSADESATSTTAPGKGGNASLEGIRRADMVWQRIKERSARKAQGEDLDPPKQVVRRGETKSPAGMQSFDVVVCGGTLGILVARALQNEGYAVCIVERGVVRGRDQEWNVNAQELEPLIRQEIISKEEADQALQSSWPSSRVGMEGAHAVEFYAGALNAGVSPKVLVDAARRRFEAAGGVIMEQTMLDAIDIFDDGAVLQLSRQAEGKVQVRARLVLDAMGAGSPIVAQARNGAPPDAACLVVGTMASGFPAEANKAGDYLYACMPKKGSKKSGHQAFWEAFPSENGGRDGTERTTYYFTYVLPGLDNLPSITDVFEEYVDALPEYQNVRLEQLEVRRALCASFVAYKDCPLPTPFDRVLQVGDAAGIQSPLSFGGFGALCRHLPRLRLAISEALHDDLLKATDLSQINPYLPNLSMQWTMYRSIAQPPEDEPEFVTRMMGGILSASARCGDEVMMPILQDVFSLGSLAPTLASWMSRDPAIIPLFVRSMGVSNVAAALSHLASLTLYTGLSKLEPLLRPYADTLPAAERFQWHRRFEAWKYGSGLDYEH